MSVEAAQMAALGIVQDTDPGLTAPVQKFSLPGEAGRAESLAGMLSLTLERVRRTGTFSKGCGIAAPQIGVSRAAALIATPGDGWVVLLNPRIVQQSGDTDEQYEGCLSFFGVRGLVPRPLGVTVEYAGLDGELRVREFTRAGARLACHEIDHLNGILYTSRMRAGTRTVPVSEYAGEGQPWAY